MPEIRWGNKDRDKEKEKQTIEQIARRKKTPQICGTSSFCGAQVLVDTVKLQLLSRDQSEPTPLNGLKIKIITVSAFTFLCNSKLSHQHIKMYL